MVRLFYLMTRQQRYEFLLDYFRQQQPVVTTELQFDSPFQLLVATILSAQCTDKRVNEVTPTLFRHFPDAQTMAKATEAEVLEDVKSVSYPNSKARHLVDMARMLMTDFHGEVPCEAEALVKLPGVGRKTANVVQAVAFGKPTMAVDTHVFRVSHRLGLVSRDAKTPVKVEQQLMKHIPTDDIPRAHHWLLLHGRYICTSRAPHCDHCPFESFCPKLIERPK
jgi:endonuclease-3